MAKEYKNRQSAAGVFNGGRSDMSIQGLLCTFREHLFYTQGRFPIGATRNDLYMALAYTVRDQLLHRRIKTVEQLSKKKDLKVVSYLSAEFLLGPHLENNLINLGIYDDVCRVCCSPISGRIWMLKTGSIKLSATGNAGPGCLS